MLGDSGDSIAIAENIVIEVNPYDVLQIEENLRIMEDDTNEVGVEISNVLETDVEINQTVESEFMFPVINIRSDIYEIESIGNG